MMALEADRLSFSYGEAPMAANVQLVFFRKKASDDILVKFMHCEKEVEYPHCGPCDLEFKPAAFGGSGPPGTLPKAVYGATARNPACQPVAVRF